MKKVLAFAAFVMTVMMAFGAAPTKGLIAYYPFDGDAKDKSGNHNDGVMLGTRPTADRKGRLNSAMLFGEGNYITVPSSKSLNSPTEQITIAAWVRVSAWFNNNWGDSATILAKGSNLRDTAYRLEFFSNLKVVNTGGITAQNVSSVVCSHLHGEWHHVAMVSDGKIAKVYIDGVIVGAGTVAGRPDRYGPVGELFIGHNTLDNDECLIGAMDELRIYNRALSDEEIKALYEADPQTKTNKMETKGWHVTTFDCTVRSIGDAEATVQSNMGMMAEGDYSVLAFTNDGRAPYSEQHLAFPGKNACLVMRANGTVRIPSAGMWTFGISCDDGAKIRIKGKDFVDVIALPEHTEWGVKTFPINIPAAGDYEMEVIHFDNRGGCYLLLSAAKGNWATFDKSAFRLVGDPECEIKMVESKSASKGVRASVAANSETDKTCPDCKGEKVRLLSCRKCFGKGTIVKSRKLDSGGTIRENVKCPACSSASTPMKGKGRGKVRTVCPTCDGEGVVR